MNKLQELQKKLCPDGVIFKKIEKKILLQFHHMDMQDM